MPVLVPTARVRFWTVTAAALALVILVGIYQAYQEYTEGKAVFAVKEEIWGLHTKHEKSLTFEQIYDNLYYPSPVGQGAQ